MFAVRFSKKSLDRVTAYLIQLAMWIQFSDWSFRLVAETWNPALGGLGLAISLFQLSHDVSINFFLLKQFFPVI